MKILSIVLFLIVFLTSCGIKENLENNPLDTSSNIGQELSGNSSSMNEDIDLGSAISLISNSLKGKEEFNACVKSNIDMCITEQAQIFPESVKCEDYLVESNRTLCNEQKKILQAKEANDISICESLTENRYECEYEVVLMSALGNGDVTQCRSLSDEYRIPCNNEVIKKKALDAGDIKLCEGIISYVDGDMFERKFCEDEVQFSIDEKNRIEDEQEVQKTLEKEMLDNTETQEELSGEEK